MFLEEGAGDFAGFGEGGAGDEDEAELRGGRHGVNEKIVADLDFVKRRKRKDNAEDAKNAENTEKRAPRTQAGVPVPQRMQKGRVKPPLHENEECE